MFIQFEKTIVTLNKRDDVSLDVGQSTHTASIQEFKRIFLSTCFNTRYFVSRLPLPRRSPPAFSSNQQPSLALNTGRSWTTTVSYVSCT